MRTLREFLDCERGSVSLWNLFWLTSFCALLGLAVDITAAMNTRAHLQNVADVSAHAGVMDISPLPVNAVMTSMEYSFQNIPQYRNVVNENDIVLGWWDPETRTFDSSNPEQVNAVQVIATRDTERRNATDTTFMGVVGFHAWDVNAIAIATVAEMDLCRANGMFAGGTMEQTSNNTILQPFCMYGHEAFKIGQNNLIECGSVLMTPGPENFQNGQPPAPQDACNEDYAGLSGDDMLAQSFVYKRNPVTARAEYMKVKETVEAYIGGQPINDIYNVVPTWVTNVQTLNVSAFNKLSKKAALVPGTMYHVTCGGSNSRAQLSGIVRNIAMFTDCAVDVRKDKDVSAEKPTKTESGTKALCDPDDADCNSTDWIAEITKNRWSCAQAAAAFERYTTLLDGTYRDGTVDLQAEECGIEPGANGVMDNFWLFTSFREGGNTEQKAVTFPNNMQLGRIDGCTEGGGVHIFSAGSVDTPSGTVAHGLQIVTLGSVQFSAKANGAWGINIQAMNDIKYTANGTVGGCSIDPGDRESEVIQTARPITIVR